MNKLPKSILTYFLVCTFGIGSWIAVNGIWAEISILVNCSPEYDKLPAILVVIIQVANMGVLVYVIIKYLVHRCHQQVYQLYLEIGTVLVLIFIGISSCLLLAFFWNKQSVFFGKVHSISLFVLTFFLALVDCTSSVVFAFMQHFPSEYLSALYIGEGLSGLLPSIFALSQGSISSNISTCNDPPGYKALGIRFSPNVYFVLLGGLVLLSGISFVAIITLPAVRRHMVYGVWKSLFANSHTQDQIGSPDPSKEEPVQQHTLRFTLMCTWDILRSNTSLYVCLGVLSFLTNSAISAVSSYVFHLYDNNVYHVTINLSLIANPLMSFFFFLFPSKSRVITVVTTVIVCVLSIYVLVMAQSPAPAFQTSTFGKIMIVSCIFITVSLNT